MIVFMIRHHKTKKSCHTQLAWYTTVMKFMANAKTWWSLFPSLGPHGWCPFFCSLSRPTNTCLVYRVVCLFTPQFSLLGLLTLSTSGGQEQVKTTNRPRSSTQTARYAVHFCHLGCHTYVKARLRTWRCSFVMLTRTLTSERSVHAAMRCLVMASGYRSPCWKAVSSWRSWALVKWLRWRRPLRRSDVIAFRCTWLSTRRRQGG